MKKLLFITFFVPIILHAQVVHQKVHVRKINYTKNCLDKPVEEVRVKVETEERTDKNGNVTLKITDNSDKTFIFSDIYRLGFTLISPTIEELNRKKYSLSPNAAIPIVIGDNYELRAERNRVENNFRKENDAKIDSMRNILSEKEAELTKLKENDLKYVKLLHERDSIEYVLHDFSQKYYKSDKFITEEADKLSKIDYNSLDSIEQIKVELMKAGKGLELVAYTKSLLPVNESYIAKNITAELAKSDIDIERREKDLATAKKERAENIALRDLLAKSYKDIAKGYELVFIYDSAEIYLKKRLNLDTTSFDYNYDYAIFLDFSSQFRKALYYYFEAVNGLLNLNQGKENKVADIFVLIGSIYNLQGNEEKALEYYNKALTIYESDSKANAIKIANCYDKIGEVYYNFNDPQNAFKCVKKAERILLGCDDKKSDLIAIYNHLGVFYDGFKQNYSKSFMYLKKALSLCETSNDFYESNLVSTMCNLSLNKYHSGDYNSALEYSIQALDLQKSKNRLNHYPTNVIYSHLGEIYRKLGNYTKSIEYYLKDISLSETIYINNEYYGKRILFNNIGFCYYMNGDTLNALKYFYQANYIGMSFITLGSLDKIYKDIDLKYYNESNFTGALQYYNEILRIHDSILGKVDSSFNEIKFKIDILSKYLKPHIFLFLIDNSESIKKGFYGSYVVLKYDDWEIGDKKELLLISPVGNSIIQLMFENQIKKRSKSEGIVLMNDKGIIEYNFGNEMMQMKINIEQVSPERYREIMQQYVDWKKQNNK